LSGKLKIKELKAHDVVISKCPLCFESEIESTILLIKMEGMSCGEGLMEMSGDRNEIRVMNISEKKCVEKMEEEKMHKREEWIKDREVEMIEKVLAIPLSSDLSTYLTFLAYGMSCVEPFEKEIVDQRDTLLSFILTKHEHIHHSDRMMYAIKFCEKIIPLVLHILSIGEYEFEWLHGFGPIGIGKSGEVNYVIVCHSGLLENVGIIGEREKYKSELGS
jgi:hypothetical protein